MLEVYSNIIPLPPCTVSMEHMQQIYKKLEKLTEDAADRQFSAISKLNQHTANVENLRALVKSWYKITVCINGKDGSVLSKTGDIEIFSSSQIPSIIQSIYFDSETAYKSQSKDILPPNSFALLIDFTEPNVFNWKSSLSAPTPNNSFLKIQGRDNAWISGIKDAVLSVLSANKNRRGFLHKHYIYDTGLVFFSIPFSFYTCYLYSPIIENHFYKKNYFLGNFAYIYIFILVTILYRVLFEGTKSIYPPFELTTAISKPHRVRKLFLFIFIQFLAFVSIYLQVVPRK